MGNTQANPLQKVDYRYNIRGWLTDINDNALAHGHLFYFHLGYTDGANPLYNGNISQTIWKTRGDNTLRSYQYSYDKLNRLTQADYLNVSNNIADTYNVFIDYDKNGNIMHLHRNGGFEDPTVAPAIDQLEYGYATNSNQLLNVSDATNDAQGFKDGNSQQNGDDYAYDAYGNMIKDQNKGITHITYNHMNLPTEIDFVNNRKITYLYTAMGTKLQKTIDYGSHQVVTDYCDGYQYETKPVAQGGRGYAELLFFPTAEGYVKALYKDDLNEKAPAAFQYIYIYKDHLGNNRLSYTLDPQTEQVKILEENHYYPFGLKHGNYNNTKKEVKYKEELAEKKEVKQVMADKMAFKYKYNGKELQDELGLNWYDYGARNYQADLGRWFNVDPLSEKYESWSAYQYVRNNPISRFDINGMSDYTINSKTGEVKLVKKNDDKTDRILKSYTRKSKRGQAKYRRNGKPKVAFGGIEKGILSDGLNFKKNDVLIEVGGEEQPTKGGVKSFALQLQEYVGKEIKGFSYSSDGSGKVTDMVLGKYKNNDRTHSVATPKEFWKKYETDYSPLNIVQQFHTHPDGDTGATERAPHLSKDVKNLQKNKRIMPNATFIILYRIPDQLKPGEYDYTHEYRKK